MSRTQSDGGGILQGCFTVLIILAMKAVALGVTIWFVVWLLRALGVLSA